MNKDLILVLVLVLILSLIIIISSRRITAIRNARNIYSEVVEWPASLKYLNMDDKGVFTLKDNIEETFYMDRYTSNVINNVLKNEGFYGLVTFDLKILFWSLSFLISVIVFIITLVKGNFEENTKNTKIIFRRLSFLISVIVLIIILLGPIEKDINYKYDSIYNIK
uniref:Uncharacterized protein n=1 Tax=viral metagenome TaxID=1070528 RepID=A0A6C0EFA2_9ZZZZ